MILTYLEFYSGVGGWGYALEAACRSLSASFVYDEAAASKRPRVAVSPPEPDEGGVTTQASARLLAAFDHSDLCNGVFQHNHKDIGKRCKPRQTPIERLSLDELEQYDATVWCLSPPCQPHTRQHSNQHRERDDPRSSSFLHLCDLLIEMDEDMLPNLLLLENVVGFEQNWAVADDCGRDDMGSFTLWRKVLCDRQYETAHFHLDPTDVGIPNNRPRHYTVAFRRGRSLRRRLSGGRSNEIHSFTRIEGLEKLFARETLDKPPIIHDERSLSRLCSTSEPTRIEAFLDPALSPASLEQLRIPKKIRESSGAWCFDIVTPEQRRSSCFTHSYGKFIRGTGSILYTGPVAANDCEGDALPRAELFELADPKDRAYDESWSKRINWEEDMRYLSGTEIARLFGFPVDCASDGPTAMRSFEFPSTCTMKQQWKLLGNSINVIVASTVAYVGVTLLCNED